MHVIDDYPNKLWVYFGKTRETVGIEEGFGLPSTIRTCDLRLRRALLYPAELWADKCWNLSYTKRKWSEYKDSNLGPPAPKAGALPGCATLRRNRYSTPRASYEANPVRFASWLPIFTANLPSKLGLLYQSFCCCFA